MALAQLHSSRSNALLIKLFLIFTIPGLILLAASRKDSFSYTIIGCTIGLKPYFKLKSLHMPAPESPCSKNEIDESQNQKSNHLGNGAADLLTLNKDFMECFNSPGGRENIIGHNGIITNSEELSSRNGKGSPGKEHQKEQWKCPNNGYLLYGAGHGCYQKTETDHGQRSE